ncbi:MAG: hypothetical protein GXP34_08025 [Actinobacteria bacterium]|nr:hypothetical protein [Actinomycetota bacterium]
MQRIFAEYLAGKGLYAIAEGLTADGIPSPSAHDPARNPRYTGHQVWNRQRRDETLIDVNDVALGHQTRMRWNNPDDWI